ncbi:hypothetical protein [Corynebacterium halotolerans]|uniref:hypothetical protein n=1 Tax=Corynebacterium halotolerans TaxID=225326 RepID=UPI003CEE4F2D
MTHDLEDHDGFWSVLGATAATPGSVAYYSNGDAIPVTALLMVEHVQRPTDYPAEWAAEDGLAIGSGRIKAVAAVMDQQGEVVPASSLPGFTGIEHVHPANVMGGK